MNMFEGVRRRFCVQAGEEEHTELLSIDKADLLKMRSEFRVEFVEFFQTGLSMLEKTIKLRNHAMELCDKRANKWNAGIVKQEIKVFTNKELSRMRMEKLTAHCKREIS
jgi:hypothetical protein